MIAAILLAAGASRRFGTQNKLLAEIGGEPMIVRATRMILSARRPLRPFLLVTGHQRGRIRRALLDAGLPRLPRLVHNPVYRSGMASSLRAGLRALPPQTGAALICLADMPFLDAGAGQDGGGFDVLVSRMAAVHDRAPDAILLPVIAGRRGNPVLWPARLFKQMAALQGDIGARRLIAQHAAQVRKIPFADKAPLFDIDTPEHLSRLNRHHAFAR